MMSGGMMSGGMMSGGMMSGGMMSGGMMSGGYEGGYTNDDDYGVSHHSIDFCSIAKTQLVYKNFNTNSNVFFALPFIHRKEKVV
jgi:hypothetical protein